MRNAIAVTLILCGTFLVALPPVTEFMRMRTVARLFDHPVDHSTHRSIDLGPHMSPEYSFGCFALGSVMMATAVFVSLVSSQVVVPRRAPAAATN